MTSMEAEEEQQELGRGAGESASSQAESGKTEVETNRWSSCEPQVGCLCLFFAFFPPPQNNHNVLFSASGLSGRLKMTLLSGLIDV